MSTSPSFELEAVLQGHSDEAMAAYLGSKVSGSLGTSPQLLAAVAEGAA
jgi:hypothetical protein